MEIKALLATLNETLREVSDKLAQSDAVLIRMRAELAAFRDILRHAKDRETRANHAYDGSAPNSYPTIKKIGKLSAEQTRTLDERLAAAEAVKKYQEEVRAAERGIAIEESRHKSLQKARDDLTWQIKKLGSARN